MGDHAPLPPGLLPPPFTADELHLLMERASAWAYQTVALHTHANAPQRAETFGLLAQAAHHLRAMLLMDAYYAMNEAMFGPPENPPENGEGDAPHA